MSRILVSLGGNALGTEFDELVESVGIVAKPIVGLLEAGHEVVICHGNGPQVGMIKSSIDHGRASFNQPSVPLSEAVAMSQAYVGYHLQNAIENQLHARGLHKTVCARSSRGPWLTRTIRCSSGPRSRSAPSSRPRRPRGCARPARR